MTIISEVRERNRGGIGGAVGKKGRGGRVEDFIQQVARKCRARRG